MFVGGQSADLFVAGEQLAAGGHPRHVEVEAVGAGVLAVVAQQAPAQVQQRIADCGHLPVHDRGQPGRSAVRVHDVGELVVAVHDAGGVVRAAGCGAASPRPRRGREVPGPGRVCRKFEPAVHLTLVKAVRAAEPLEALGPPVDGAEFGRALDELERQVATGVEVGVERRLPAAAHRAPPVDLGHYVERLAEDFARFVGRDQLGVRHVGALESAHQPDFPQQAVEPGGVRARSGRPQHHLLVAATNAVQRVLRSTGEQFQHRLLARARRVVLV